MNPKESPFSSSSADEDDDHKLYKSWLAYVEFVDYFKGGRQADRGANTPFGKLKKHSSEMLIAARGRIATFQGKEEYKLPYPELVKKQIANLLNIFVCDKIATSRNDVDQMFSDRAALYSEIKRSRTGKKGRGEKEVRSSLKRNSVKINQLIDFVDFWELRHAKLHRWEHSKYDRDHIRQWMGGDEPAVKFPLWKILYKSHGDENSGLISDTGGCGSSSLWYLAYQYVVLHHDVDRIQEEVHLMEVEIQRMKIYYDRRIRLLKDEMVKAVVDAKQAVPAGKHGILAVLRVGHTCSDNEGSKEAYFIAKYAEACPSEDFSARAKALGFANMASLFDDVGMTPSGYGFTVASAANPASSFDILPFFVLLASLFVMSFKH